jgi:hypothetical protein
MIKNTEKREIRRVTTTDLDKTFTFFIYLNDSKQNIFFIFNLLTIKYTVLLIHSTSLKAPKYYRKNGIIFGPGS